MRPAIQLAPEAPARKRLILHIGTEKTGSSAIQFALAEKVNQKKLRDAGILIPKVLGPNNHTHLVAASLDDAVCDNVKAHILSQHGLSVKQLRRAVAIELEKELAVATHWQTLIATSELIHSRLTKRDEIRRLLSFFDPYVDDIIVMMFLRRQDQLAVSRYSSALRAGHTGFDDVFGNIASHIYFKLPNDRAPNDFIDYYNYRHLIERFLPFVDPMNIRIALYPEMLGPSKNAIDCFCRMIGIDPDLTKTETPFRNPGMSVEAQYVMSEVNKRVPASEKSGLRNRSLKKVHTEIEKRFKGRTRQMPCNEAMRFLDRFSESNDWVRATFFPERDRLFEDDFSTQTDDVDYSELKISLQPVVDDFARLAAQLPHKDTFLRLVARRLRRVFKRCLL